MALDKKLQDIFNWYVRTRKISADENFYKFTTKLEKKLKDSGLEINAAMFIHKVFDALEYPNKSLWSPEYGDLLVFFDSLPERMLQSNWNSMMPYLKREDWGRYNRKYAKSKASSSFIDSLDSDPIMLINEDSKKNLIFSVFLGNITNKVGITKDDLDRRYDDVYDSIEQELGYEAIAKHLPTNISVLDWPNASILTNAKYEFLIKAHSDPAIGDIQNSIVVALKKLGL